MHESGAGVGGAKDTGVGGGEVENQWGKPKDLALNRRIPPSLKYLACRPVKFLICLGQRGAIYFILVGLGPRSGGLLMRG